jgi:hypothetical protein
VRCAPAALIGAIMLATVAATMSEADCNNDAARCLEAAVRLGHLEAARELLLDGVQLRCPLCKEDLEMTTKTEETRCPSRARRWLRPWSWDWSLGCAAREIWELASDHDRDDFSDDPEQWSDSHGNLWINVDSDEGICFFGWWCQDAWCEWATDWDQPIHECQARASTPTTLLLLALASAGELSTLEIAEDGLARLLDASILLGKPGAAAKIVELFPQV